MRLAFKSAVPVHGGSHASRPSASAFPGPRLAAAASVQPAATPSCSSSGDTCSLGGGSSSFAGGSLAASGQAKRNRVTPPAAAPESAVKTTTGSVDKHWWNQDKDLWIEAHTEEDFRREISTGNKLVAVDFFATWCHGCEKSYPEICRVVKDAELQKKYKFVKVCVDELKSIAKSEGITGLPRMAVYQPGYGQLALLDVPFSKVKFLKTNLNVISGNPGMAFGVDPNGFVVPKGKLPSSVEATAAAEKKRREVEALNSGTGGLFERLLKVAGGGGGGGAKDKEAEAAPQGSSSSSSSGSSANGAHASTMTSSSSGHSSSSSSSTAAPVKAPSELVKPAGSCKAPPGVDAAAYEGARKAFLAAHSAEYGYGGVIDEMYPKEVGCRMQPNEHYMDYTGSSVYCQTQLDNVFAELKQCMFGNPHSANPSSSFTSERVEEVRDMVLHFFNASAAEYQVVFTKSATDGLKLVGETFPWSEGSMFRYLRENHNSVLGIREYALQGGGAFQAVNETFVDRWALRGDPAGDHVPPAPRLPAPITYSLFTFPAEDNFAGVKYPLEWVRAIQSRSTDSHRWLVMVDAAAYVPTQPLDLSKTPVDFVDLSFYKMFGFPTGVGALIVKTSVVPLMRKVFWGGGTVALATSEDNFHVLKCKPSDRLEDGTVAFLDVIAVKHGIAMMNSLGGIGRVQAHVASLTEWLYTRLSTMRHSNGAPMLAIFGKHHLPNHRAVQGGILNFELLRPDGSIFSYKTFEREAATAGFHVRTGAECNPGACYNYLGVKEAEVESLAGKKEGCEDDVEFIRVQRPVTASQEDIVSSSDLLRSIANSNISLNHPAAVALKWVEVPLGSVRVSLGWWSTFDDVYALGDWIERTYRDRTE